MIVISDLKRHPVALVTYVIYLFMWVLFTAMIIQISSKQAESGIAFCGTGVIVTYYFMLILSGVYLVSTFSFFLLNSDKRFFINLVLAIVVPMVLAFLWQFIW